MRNRHPGKCFRCGTDVPAGTGHFQRDPGRGWLVRCKACVGKGNASAKAVTNQGRK